MTAELRASPVIESAGNRLGDKSLTLQFAEALFQINCRINVTQIDINRDVRSDIACASDVVSIKTRNQSTYLVTPNRLRREAARGGSVYRESIKQRTFCKKIDDRGPISGLGAARINSFHAKARAAGIDRRLEIGAGIDRICRARFQVRCVSCAI